MKLKHLQPGIKYTYCKRGVNKKDHPKVLFVGTKLIDGQNKACIEYHDGKQAVLDPGLLKEFPMGTDFFLEVNPETIAKKRWGSMRFGQIVQTDTLSYYAGEKEAIRLVNLSEIWFVQQLEKRGIPWMSEERLFTWDDFPNFCPDYYFPKINLYVELTLVHNPKIKLEKIRLLKSKYPDIKITLLDAPKVKELIHWMDGMRKEDLERYLLWNKS